MRRAGLKPAEGRVFSLSAAPVLHRPLSARAQTADEKFYAAVRTAAPLVYGQLLGCRPL